MNTKRIGGGVFVRLTEAQAEYVDQLSRETGVSRPTVLRSSLLFMMRAGGKTKK